MAGHETRAPEREYPTDGPAPSLIEAGFALEIADAPLLHDGLNLADIAHVTLAGPYTRASVLMPQKRNPYALAIGGGRPAGAAGRVPRGGENPLGAQRQPHLRLRRGAAAQAKEQATGAAAGLAAAEDALLTMAREVAKE